jgi:hypothetical protein
MLFMTCAPGHRYMPLAKANRVTLATECTLNRDMLFTLNVHGHDTTRLRERRKTSGSTTIAAAALCWAALAVPLC